MRSGIVMAEENDGDETEKRWRDDKLIHGNADELVHGSMGVPGHARDACGPWPVSGLKLRQSRQGQFTGRDARTHPCAIG